MSQGDDPGAGTHDTPDRPGRAWLYLVVVAAAIVVPVAVVIWMSMPRPPSVEYRPAAVDVVVSFEQAGAAWDVGLESGTRLLLTDSVHDLLRPVSGAPLSPRVGDLVMTDSPSSPTWVAFSEGGSGVPGEPCFAIHEEAFVAGDRIVFRSGLSVPIGSWRRDPPPSPNEVIAAGACLDRQGHAVERLLGFGFWLACPAWRAAAAGWPPRPPSPPAGARAEAVGRVGSGADTDSPLMRRRLFRAPDASGRAKFAAACTQGSGQPTDDRGPERPRQ